MFPTEGADRCGSSSVVAPLWRLLEVSSCLNTFRHQISMHWVWNFTAGMWGSQVLRSTALVSGLQQQSAASAYDWMDFCTWTFHPSMCQWVANLVILAVSPEFEERVIRRFEFYLSWASQFDSLRSVAKEFCLRRCSILVTFFHSTQNHKISFLSSLKKILFHWDTDPGSTTSVRPFAVYKFFFRIESVACTRSVKNSKFRSLQ